jgi:hypothetical protein
MGAVWASCVRVRACARVSVGSTAFRHWFVGGANTRSCSYTLCCCLCFCFVSAAAAAAYAAAAAAAYAAAAAAAAYAAAAVVSAAAAAAAVSAAASACLLLRLRLLLLLLCVQVLWQVGSLQGLCRSSSKAEVAYIKPHGALYHAIMAGASFVCRSFVRLAGWSCASMCLVASVLPRHDGMAGAFDWFEWGLVRRCIVLLSLVIMAGAFSLHSPALSVDLSVYVSTFSVCLPACLPVCLSVVSRSSCPRFVWSCGVVQNTPPRLVCIRPFQAARRERPCSRPAACLACRCC